jgi:succinate-semialdehyde dehydrogenase / glutarate-semialdehyde dehydrogenase
MSTTFRSVNPANGDVIAEYKTQNLASIAQCIDHSHRVFKLNKKFDIDTRSKWLKDLAQGLRANAKKAAELMALEMGKPVPQGLSEVEKCAFTCEYLASHVGDYYQSEHVVIPTPTGFGNSSIHFSPLGVILGIMPWNFPFWQVIRFAVPAILMGNTIVIKHSPEVTGCALLLDSIFQQVLPEFTYQTILATTDVLADVIAHPFIAGVSLTGSTRAGKAVAEIAGRHLKKTVLELGGSDPYIILDTADVEYSARICVESRCVNSGQSCVAAKRFIVTQKNREEFEHYFTLYMTRKKTGNPFENGVDIGPMARRSLRDELLHQVKSSLDKGATLLYPTYEEFSAQYNATQGQQDLSAFFNPVVMTNVQKGMPAYSEELFGVAGAIIPVVDEDEAIRVANDSVYGLGGAIFTRDTERGERIAREDLIAGMCVVNDSVRSDVRLPFGGLKWSGWGRELSAFGVREFTNVKTVSVFRAT